MMSTSLKYHLELKQKNHDQDNLFSIKKILSFSASHGLCLFEAASMALGD